MQISFIQECYRKMVHLSSLIYPLLYLITNKTIVLLIIIPLFIIVLLWDSLRIFNINISILNFISNILRPEEKNQKKFCGATWFLLSCCLLVYFFPKHIAIISMLVLIISDTLAALVGRKYGKIKFLNKTLEGSVAFFISALIIVIGYSYFYNVSYGYSLVFTAVFITTLAELFAKEIKVDDNFLITIVMAIILNL